MCAVRVFGLLLPFGGRARRARYAAPYGGAYRSGPALAAPPRAGAHLGRLAYPEARGHRDPAPSLWAYRMDRLWLTPLFRALMRVGLPTFLFVFAVGLYLHDDARRGALMAKVQGLRQSVEDRPEYSVKLLSIEGASPSLAGAVREIAALKLPQSSLALDLPAIRARIETLDAVAGADLRIAPGGVLQVKIRERVPVIVWRRPPAPGETGLDLLDGEGRRVAMLLTRSDRPDLPLIAGEGANGAVPEALALLQVAAPLAPRLRGLVRQGDRRWDVVLDREQRLLLPEEGAMETLAAFLERDAAEGILARDILSVDLRFPGKMTLRLAPPALAAWRGLPPPGEAEGAAAVTEASASEPLEASDL